VIDGTGKTLVPGLWDSHMHVSDDFQRAQRMGDRSHLDPQSGGSIELAQSQRKRRAEGTLVDPETFTSVIVDQKGPLAAQGSITVSSLDETSRQCARSRRGD
jgi:imidazolonepropionase-like amidohydrolase